MTKFEDIIKTVLELLHEKFLVEANKPDSKKSIKVSIYPRDLSRYDIDVETIGDVVTVLNKKDKSISFLNLFDSDEFNAETMKGNEPSIWDIELPSNFYNKFNKLKDFYKKSTNNNLKEKNIKIVLDVKKDCLSVNSINISIPKETIERSMLNILVDMDTEVSWDEIYDIHEPRSQADIGVKKKTVGDARKRLNEKIIKRSVLKDELIKRRRGNYSLTKKVTKK